MRRPLHPQRPTAARTGRRAAWFKRRHRKLPTRSAQLELTEAILRVVTHELLRLQVERDRQMIRYLSASA